VQTDKMNQGVKFFVLPTRHQVFTLTKAPIAHKLWSKEQYKFIFYLLRVSFVNKPITLTNISSINQGLTFALTTKKSLPLFSTNLLILKTATTSFTLVDSAYFSLF
jgi:hypothetical protein